MEIEILRPEIPEARDKNPVQLTPLEVTIVAEDDEPAHALIDRACKPAGRTGCHYIRGLPRFYVFASTSVL